jgi:hypothetical protein
VISAEIGAEKEKLTKERMKKNNKREKGFTPILKN